MRKILESMARQFFASTSIGDAIEPSVWVPYMVERTAEVSELFSSGIITQTDRLDRIAAAGGTTAHIPHWGDLSGSSQPGDNDITFDNITAEEMIAVQHFRNKGWSDDDIVSMIAGDDPGREIANGVAEYWAREIQRYLIYTLTGVFSSAGPLNPSHVHDVATPDGDSAGDVLIQASHFIRAANLLGDAWDQIVGIAVHSKVFADMQEKNLITDRTAQEQDIDFNTFLGRRVIVDDSLPVDVGSGSPAHDIYHSYLFGTGAVGYGEGSPDNPVETDRDVSTSGGQDLLVTRRSWIIHPQGIKWTGSGSGITGGTNNITPTQGDLEDGNNYDKVFEDKNIPLIELRTN